MTAGGGLSSFEEATTPVVPTQMARKRVVDGDQWPAFHDAVNTQRVVSGVPRLSRYSSAVGVVVYATTSPTVDFRTGNTSQVTGSRTRAWD